MCYNLTILHLALVTGIEHAHDVTLFPGDLAMKQGPCSIMYRQAVDSVRGVRNPQKRSRLEVDIYFSAADVRHTLVRRRQASNFSGSQQQTPERPLRPSLPQLHRSFHCRERVFCQPRPFRPLLQPLSTYPGPLGRSILRS